MVELDYTQRLEARKLTTIKDRRIRGDLIHYYKIKNGLDDIRFLKEPKILKSRKPHDQKIEREFFNIISKIQFPNKSNSNNLE